MTEYEVEEHNLTPHGTEWHVTSMDDNGSMHVTIFIGPIAELRARTYAEHMNAMNKHPVLYPGE